MNFLSSYKPLVDERIARFLDQKKEDVSKVNPWGSDVIQKLLPFSTRGKTIRGSLTLFSYSLFQRELSSAVIDAAAALELFHSGFLIHDDIMDGDSQRRGMPTFHEQYKSTDVAICVGDLCFFLGHELLPAGVTKYVSRELSYVTIAQMQDVAGAQTKEDILSLYTYKTARYSFSVPFVVGAMLGNANEETVLSLEKLGEKMGLLFQIRDDELARSQEGDTRNNKKTLATVVTKEMLANYQDTRSREAKELIATLSIDSTQRSNLVWLVDFCHNRQT